MIKLYGGMMDFTQEGNCCDGGNELLRVRIKDGGGGKYFVLETEQWSIDNVGEIKVLLDKVGKAFEMKKETKG